MGWFPTSLGIPYGTDLVGSVHAATVSPSANIHLYINSSVLRRPFFWCPPSPLAYTLFCLLFLRVNPERRDLIKTPHFVMSILRSLTTLALFACWSLFLLCRRKHPWEWLSKALTCEYRKLSLWVWCNYYHVLGYLRSIRSSGS